MDAARQSPVPVDFQRVARELGLSLQQVEQATALLDSGNTIPFITRYRKERTGNLNEEQLRTLLDRVTDLRQLRERADTILRLIASQGKLTPDLQAAIEQADSLKRLDDLYLPYRPKKRSRASQARERGLEPLAELVWQGDASLADRARVAAAYVSAERELPDAAAVWLGVQDLLVERIGDHPDLRSGLRDLSWHTGRLLVTAVQPTSEAAQPYRDYFDYREGVQRIPPHRILALNRGEKEGALRVKFEWDDESADGLVTQQLQLDRHPALDLLRPAAAEALRRVIQPSLEREIRRELTDGAESHAVGVFARNLRNLLLQPPLPGKRVLAIDPGFRTGCKLAALDEIGNCLQTDVLYVTGSADKRQAAKQKLIDMLEQHQTRLVVIGNGTACRESEELVAEVIAESLPELQYSIVNEAGASVYSASQIAREEFPDFDASLRGTISIGRRLQDPLSELVKIEPQHIGVGLYQHDLNPKRLKESLELVVESCVNYVGVDLNTASPALLSRVSGLNQLTARRVVDWRMKHGRFTNRQQLREVTGIGEATFTQAAGFLKISSGEEPLDQTWIHPESYPVARQLLQRLELTSDILQPGNSLEETLRQKTVGVSLDQLAQELKTGLPTLRDMLEALGRPGRDPRGNVSGHVFKRGILKLEDLSPGMELKGTVLNVVDFGAFVDVGLKDSGLVHISQLSRQYVRSPDEVVAVGQAVTVWVLSIDLDRRRVSLTMLDPAQPRSSGKGDRHKAPAAPAESAAPRTADKPAGRKPASPPADAQAPAGETLRGFDELKRAWQNRK